MTIFIVTYINFDDKECIADIEAENIEEAICIIINELEYVKRVVSIV